MSNEIKTSYPFGVPGFNTIVVDVTKENYEAEYLCYSHTGSSPVFAKLTALETMFGSHCVLFLWWGWEPVIYPQGLAVLSP